MGHNYNIYYFIEKFNREEIIQLNKKINIILRNHQDSFSKSEIKEIIKICRKKKQKIFISNNLKIAIKFNFDGLYISSFNKLSKFKNKNFKKNFKLIGSAHNSFEILQKINQGCEEIFLSPLFNTYKKNYLGIIKFNKQNLTNSKKVIALGGINKDNLNKLKLTKAIGFASISWIKKTGLQLSRPA